MKILDIGSGIFPKGDINIDPNRFNKEGKGPRQIKNKVEIIATGEYLPFPDNSFDRVLSFHSIEHSLNADLFLKEMIRTTKGEIEIHCPHRMGKGAKNIFHRSYITFSWLINSVNKLNCEVIDFHSTLTPQRILYWFYILRINEIVFKAKKKVREK